MVRLPGKWQHHRQREEPSSAIRSIPAKKNYDAHFERKTVQQAGKQVANMCYNSKQRNSGSSESQVKVLKGQQKLNFAKIDAPGPSSNSGMILW